MAQPLLARMREKLPGVEIDLLAPEWVAAVARRMPEVREVIAAPFRHGALQLRERWKLGRTLKLRGYDQAIVLPNTWKSALVPFFADIPLRSGYVGESRYGLLNLLYKKQAAAMALHYARLSEPPGKAPQQPLPAPRLRVAPGEVAAATRRFGLEGPYAVLCPGPYSGRDAPLRARRSLCRAVPRRGVRAGQALALLQGAGAVPRHRGRSPGFRRRPRVGRRHPG